MKRILLAVVFVLFLGVAYIWWVSSSPEIQISPDTQITSEEISYQQCVETWGAELCGMFDAEERQGLYAACAEADIPPTADDMSVYPNLNIAVVRWWDGELQENVEQYIPYEPETGFVGCSTSAQELLELAHESAQR